MSRSTRNAVAVAAAGIVLLGVAGTIAVWTSRASVPGVMSVSQQQWAFVVVAIGLIGYTAAMVVAAFGKRPLRRAKG